MTKKLAKKGCPPPRKMSRGTTLGRDEQFITETESLRYNCERCRLLRGAVDINSSNAFTLAEVLITLGIIGIVAALTLPSLIVNQQKKEISARLKKFYSMMSQAVILSENDNGPAGDWDKSDALREEDGTLIDTPDSSIAFFKKYFAPYMKIITIEKDESNKAYAVFADGSTVTFTNGNCVDMVFDTNGKRRPNIEGRDRYRFLYCNSKYNENYIDKNKYFGTYYQFYILTQNRNYLINLCRTAKHTCATLLLNDDWEIKDDYPW